MTGAGGGASYPVCGHLQHRPSRTLGPVDDTELVHQARGGSRAAWGEIYDRYADQLHDYCYTILRDRHEAEDALHDAFMAAAGRLDQLRDPARLRPWLYAICRTQALGRARRRGRVVPTEEVVGVSGGPGATATPPVGPAERAEQSELARLVQDAAGGLAPRDRSVLALHLRHGLDGADLGEALGVDAHHANVLLSRVRDQVERSLGALLVARTGRQECPELDRILAGWDGGLTPLLRKRVARHVDNCATCGERRRRVASPLALLAGAPVVAAPPSLRERVLDGVVHISSSGPGQGQGRGRSSPPAGAPGRRRALAAAGAAAALVLGGLAVLASGRDDPESNAVVASGPGTTTTTTTPAGPDDTTTSTPGATVASGGTTPPTTPMVGTQLPGTTTTTATPGTTSPVTTIPPAAPVVVIDTPALDFGTAGTSGQVRFTNGGGQGLAWTVTSPLGALAVSPASGVLAPGAQASVTVALDRIGAPEGPLAVDLTVGGTGVSSGATVAAKAVPVRAEVDHVPVVGDLATERPRVVFGSSTCGSTRATAVVSDESPVTVVLSWRQAVGSTTEATMGALGGGRYGTSIGPVPTPGGGDVTWWVTATDARGNQTRSADRVLPVATAC